MTLSDRLEGLLIQPHFSAPPACFACLQDGRLIKMPRSYKALMLRAVKFADAILRAEKHDPSSVIGHDVTKVTRLALHLTKTNPDDRHHLY
jgi:hypothetical protein